MAQLPPTMRNYACNGFLLPRAGDAFEFSRGQQHIKTRSQGVLWTDPDSQQTLPLLLSQLAGLRVHGKIIQLCLHFVFHSLVGVLR